MSQPSVLLLRTAGTNCDEEAAFAFRKAGADVTPVHVRRLCDDPSLLDAHAILMLPGGFSYGDDLGSGVVLANEIVQRLAEPFARFVERGGLVLGVCNGFQVLVKTGLLPGASYRTDTREKLLLPTSVLDLSESQDAQLISVDIRTLGDLVEKDEAWLRAHGVGEENVRAMQAKLEGQGLHLGMNVLPESGRAATLTHNDSQRFEDRWVWLRVEENESPFLRGHAGRTVTFPVAHGEGKFVARDEDTLRRIVDGRQVAFRYATAEGGEPGYPANPNGSAQHIAGITDPTGRVLGLMPHPERHVLPWQHPRWTREGLREEADGLFMFRNAVEYARGN